MRTTCSDSVTFKVLLVRLWSNDLKVLSSTLGRRLIINSVDLILDSSQFPYFCRVAGRELTIERLAAMPFLSGR
jgi:hypothetical protein